MTNRNIDEFLRAIRSDDQLRAEVRREILGGEVLDLPTQVKNNTDAIAELITLAEGNVTAIGANAEAIAKLTALTAANATTLKENTDSLGELKGIGLEVRLYNRGLSQLATLLGLHESQRVRTAEGDANSKAFNADLLKALRDKRVALDAEDYNRVLSTDMIVSAVDLTSDRPVYVAVEASYSINRADITKVGQTGSVLQELYPDAEIHRALYYVHIQPFLREEAEQTGIHLVPNRNLR